jgi:CRP-like cAMP-binding protein
VSQVEEAGNAVARMLAIKALPLLADLDPDELAVLAEHARFCTFAEGETVFAGAEAPVERIHLVLDGSVVEHRGGRPFRTHGPQRVVGGVDALARTTADVLAVATEETRTLAIDRADLRDVLEDNFGVLAATLQGVAAATLRLRRRLVPSAGFPARGDAAPSVAGSLDELGARIAFLHRYTWLGDARVRTLGQIAREAEPISVAAGASIWREGETADHGAVVVRGTVGCETADGRQRFEVGPGAVIGLEEALAMDVRWHAATARTAVSFLGISRAAFVDVLEDDPDTALELLAALATVASALRDRSARGEDDE